MGRRVAGGRSQTSTAPKRDAARLAGAFGVRAACPEGELGPPLRPPTLAATATKSALRAFRAGRS